MITYIFPPQYYLGFIVQPVPEGFEVFRPLDTCKPESYFFCCVEGTLQHIRSVIEEEGGLYEPK